MSNVSIKLESINSPTVKASLSDQIVELLRIDDDLVILQKKIPSGKQQLKQNIKLELVKEKPFFISVKNSPDGTVLKRY
jgi:hypothetical protein